MSAQGSDDLVHSDTLHRPDKRLDRVRDDASCSLAAARAKERDGIRHAKGANCDVGESWVAPFSALPTRAPTRQIRSQQR